jgi:ABC-type oligopeptide transport system ATPase subunit
MIVAKDLQKVFPVKGGKDVAAVRGIDLTVARGSRSGSSDPTVPASPRRCG